MTSLVLQPTWSRANAGIMTVPPLLDLDGDAASSFLASLERAEAEDDLPAEQLQLLRAAQANLPPE